MTQPGDDFMDSLGALGAAVLGTLQALEWTARRMHPPAIAQLRGALTPSMERLRERRDGFVARPAPAGLEAVQEELGAVASLALDAVEGFVVPGDDGIARILGAMQAQCRAQERLFPLRLALPPVNRFFVEAPFRDRLEVLDPEPTPGLSVGLHRGGGEADGRGGFHLYVPESYDGTAAWPLVVALHGGSGHGREFLWSWLREARGRRFLLLAPTSLGPTWSFGGPDVDAPRLRSMVELVCERWRVDREHVLLTGLSDGATYSLVAGLQEGMPFTHLAPLSGVLHPLNFANGNLARAAGRPIYLVHGALDWMFPVAIAQVARDELQKAGAELVYRELADLSHTYARDENDGILRWLDPRLALPASEGRSDEGSA